MKWEIVKDGIESRGVIVLILVGICSFVLGFIQGVAH